MILGVTVLFVLSQSSTSGVRLQLDEPEAALVILDKLHDNKEPVEQDWNTLFTSEGYVKLKNREAGMQRAFTNDDFKSFLKKPETIAKSEQLKKSLTNIAKLDIADCAKRPLSYLPKGTKLKATVYPLIKPKTNSFVWDVEKNPAIMLYLDPAKSAEEIKVTAAHELHHIGYSASCPSVSFKKWENGLDEAHKTAIVWIPALGEGFAVLCQMGGPNSNPYRSFDKETSSAWVQHYATVKNDFSQIDGFLQDVLNNKLDKESIQTKAFSFYGFIGPWYTVGYMVATTIESAFGRKKLIECYQDPRLLLATYNTAADKLNQKDHQDRPKWSDQVVNELSKASLLASGWEPRRN